MTIRLQFGTAGIRAALGPGEDQLNIATVRGVAQALCDYLADTFEGARGRGLCVAYDGRTDSDAFAREVVRVGLAQGFRVRAFAAPAPTPLLAFCTRFYGVAAGVVITASHNPPHDNGIKIYLERGAQVLAPHDAQIARRIAEVELGAAAPESAAPTGHELLGELEIEAYLGAIVGLVAPSSAPLPRLAYSALCGVGGAITRRLLARAGAYDVCEVAEQAEPRADFGGLASPNPEHVAALSALIALMQRERAELAFAHDPDADRLAVIARERNDCEQHAPRVLSGDEVGALLGAFLLEQCADPTRALLVSTLVSGELLERIAGAHGARFERTPTGFKWITARARELERSDGLNFLFGYEEAIGYAFGSMADDKDGIAALYVLLEIARRLHASGRTLVDRLDELAREHGLFASRQLTIPVAPGAQGGDLMARLRGIDPESVLGSGATRRDHAAIALLVFQGAQGTRLCVRPSGTEPKLKLYLHAHAAVGDRPIAQARRAATRTLDELEASVRALVA